MVRIREMIVHESIRTRVLHVYIKVQWKENMYEEKTLHINETTNRKPLL